MAFRFPRVDIPAGVPRSDWLSWKWQIRSALKTRADYEKYLHLSSDEKLAFQGADFSVQTVPYYACLARTSSSIRTMIVPSLKERRPGRQALKDPLGETAHSPVRHVIHRYPDRVVFLAADFCPIYCRYCTRKRFTAQNKKVISAAEYQKALSYIEAGRGIREVIISGGDPLVLSDGVLEKILKDLRAISHVEIIRIGSRMPAVCPMRFSKSLARLLKKYQPVFMMSHFNHPAEVTEQAAAALALLADHGIPVFNQMVLLNGVNNHPAVVQALGRRLLFLRVRPYYMFQCDPSMGTDHLRTSVENSKWIQKELWGVLSNLASARLGMDIPGGGGKVEIVPAVVKEAAETGSYKLEGWDGVKGSYVDPDHSLVQLPKDAHLYLEEWNTLCNQPYGRPLADKV